MEEKDKRTLMIRMPNLLRSIRYDQEFQRLLLSKRIFYPEQIEAFQKEKNPALEMLLGLLHGKRNDFKNFLEALKETHQENCLQILQAEEVKPTPAETDARPLRNPFTQLASSSLQLRADVNIQVKGACTFRGDGDSETYKCNMVGKHGLALILNYYTFGTYEETRIGSEVDVANLEELFKQLGYLVLVKNDLTLAETKRELEAFRNNEGHINADSTIVVIMSHGGKGVIRKASTLAAEPEVGYYFCTKGDEKMDLDEALDYFNSYKCESLAKKPKLFFIQACRGEKRDAVPPKYEHLVRDSFPSESSAYPLARKVSDTLIAYASPPGYVSHRNTAEGSWFVQAICKIFAENACDCDVETLLKKVDEHVENTMMSRMPSPEDPADIQYGKQTITTENRGFRRRFYFNPGHNHL